MKAVGIGLIGALFLATLAGESIGLHRMLPVFASSIVCVGLLPESKSSRLSTITTGHAVAFLATAAVGLLIPQTDVWIAVAAVATALIMVSSNSVYPPAFGTPFIIDSAEQSSIHFLPSLVVGLLALTGAKLLLAFVSRHPLRSTIGP